MLDSKLKADLCVISGLTSCTDEEKELIRTYQAKGGQLLFLNSKETVKLSTLNISPAGLSRQKEIS